MYGIDLPATGGGILGSLGLLLGIATSNKVVIVLSVAMIAVIFARFIRLRRGERKLPR